MNFAKEMDLMMKAHMPARSNLNPLELQMLAALERCERDLVHLLDMNGPSGITGRPPSEADPTLDIVREAIAFAKEMAK
jgi:hypothetical protein